MAFWCEVSGERVISGDLLIPRYGLWTADVLLANATTLPPQITLTVGDLSLVGNVFRQSDFAGSRGLRLVGGLGGWRTKVPARAYRNPAGVNLAMVAGDLAIECGEQMGAMVDRFLGASYARFAGPASDTLRALFKFWHVDPAGVTQGVDWPTSAVTTPFLATKRAGAPGLVQIATEAIAQWVPGAVFSNAQISSPKTVESARHFFTNSGVSRIEVMTS